MNYNAQTYCRAIDRIKDAKGTTLGYALMNDVGQTIQMKNKEIKQQMMAGALHPYNLEITKDGKLVHQPKYNYVGLSVPVYDFFNRKLNDNWALMMLREDLAVCGRLDSKGAIPLKLEGVTNPDLQYSFHIKATLDITNLHQRHYSEIQQHLQGRMPQLTLIRADKRVDARLIEFLDKIHASKIGKMIEVCNAQGTYQERKADKNVQLANGMMVQPAIAEKVNTIKEIANSNEQNLGVAYNKANNILTRNYKPGGSVGLRFGKPGQYITA